MKTKKIVSAVLTAALLVSAMLIIGCFADKIDEIIVNNNDEEVINYPIPVGKGIVKFKLADKNVRTILPDPNQYLDPVSGSNVGLMLFDVKFKRTTNDAHKNEVIFFPGDGDYHPDDGSAIPDSTDKASYTDVTSPIPILDGDYIFTITAYNLDGTIAIAGYTHPSAITIDTGATTKTGPLPLTPFFGTVNGSLDYDITIPAGTYITKKLNIYEYSDLVTPYQSIELTAGGQKIGPYDILSGYYLVKVIIESQHYLTRQYTEALHVYPGFTSTMDPISITLIQNEFEVTFDMNTSYVTADTITVTNDLDPAFDDQWIPYANKVTDPEVINPLAIPEADDPDYVFKGWYKDDTAFDKWNFAKDWVLENTTLYAKWGQDLGFEIELKVGGEAMAPLVGTKTIARDHLDGDNSITLILDPPEGTGTPSWSNIQWSTEGGVNLSSYNGLTSLKIVNGRDAAKNINFTTLFSGTGNTSFTVSVIAQNSADSLWYSRKATINVTGTATHAP